MVLYSQHSKGATDKTVVPFLFGGITTRVAGQK